MRFLSWPCADRRIKWPQLSRRECQMTSVRPRHVAPAHAAVSGLEERRHGSASTSRTVLMSRRPPAGSLPCGRARHRGRRRDAWNRDSTAGLPLTAAGEVVTDRGTDAGRRHVEPHHPRAVHVDDPSLDAGHRPRRRAAGYFHACSVGRPTLVSTRCISADTTLVLPEARDLSSPRHTRIGPSLSPQPALSVHSR